MNIKRVQPEEYGINLVPIIDVVVFLLTFFLVATKFAEVERDVRVKPPSSRNARPITTMPEELVINVTRGGSFFVGGQQRRLDDIGQLLQEAVRANPHQSVVIRGDRFAVLQFAVNVLVLCEKYGVEHAYLTTSMDT